MGSPASAWWESNLARGAGVAMLALGSVAIALGQNVPAPQTYSCVVNGKKLVSDRPIAECNGVEQRVLNGDGSVKKVVPPVPTDLEKEGIEEQKSAAAVERARQQEAVRRDRNLMLRFPNEAAHNKARQAALEDVRKGVRLSESRLAALVVERKPLTDEAEFYPSKQYPIKLKTQLDANDASAEALRELLQTQQQEVVRINQLYDAELERLKKLWGGAQPGSMGTLAGAGPAASAPRK